MPNPVAKEAPASRYEHQYSSINWTVVIVQAVVQVIVLGTLLVGYIITNERWKGGIDANILNYNAVNKAQLETNQRLQIAIEKLSDSINILAANQAKVIALVEYHMAEDRRIVSQMQQQKSK